MVSKQKTGIDVEQLNRNIDRVANRFLSTAELLDVNNSSDPQTAKIIYWGAKESIFKCSHFHGVQFNKQIIIPAFQIEKEGFFEGKLIAENKVEHYILWYFTIENNMVVYCVENRNNLQ
jgi:4'-phosphopantetheinyl transferase EntD